MVKSKKKKKAQASVVRKYEVTKTYFDQFSATARKVLQLLELDPALYDQFTKKQKLEMMHLKFDLPKVYPATEHKVPRQHIKFIQFYMNEFLENTFVGEAHIRLLYKDLFSMGIQFCTSVADMKPENHPDQADIIKLIYDRFIQYEKDKESIIVELYKFMRMISYYLSKINFRIYGFRFTGWKVKNYSLSAPFYITSTDARSTYFNYKGKLHKAYQLGLGDYVLDKPYWFKVAYNTVFTTSNDERKLNLYIQSHALNRMKERLDLHSPGNRNNELINALDTREAIQIGNQNYIKFLDSRTKLLGYLPFIIIDDCLYILSFIPLCSPNVPEGKVLCEALNTTKDDLIFLGMDKMSFYQRTDFDAIPRLKKALIEAGMWHLTEFEPEKEIKKMLPAKSAGVIAKFFEQSTPKHNTKEIFDEIEKMY
jgi:hypothetical protein